MKYFIINPIFGTLSHILVQFPDVIFNNFTQSFHVVQIGWHSSWSKAKRVHLFSSLVPFVNVRRRWILLQHEICITLFLIWRYYKRFKKFFIHFWIDFCGNNKQHTWVSCSHAAPYPDRRCKFYRIFQTLFSKASNTDALIPTRYTKQTFRADEYFFFQSSYPSNSFCLHHSKI